MKTRRRTYHRPSQPELLPAPGSVVDFVDWDPVDSGPICRLSSALQATFVDHLPHHPVQASSHQHWAGTFGYSSALALHGPFSGPGRAEATQGLVLAELADLGFHDLFQIFACLP